MAIDTSQLTDYSWSDIRKAAKAAMMMRAVGGSNLTINGRTIGRMTQQEAEDLYNFADRMVQESSSVTGTTTALGSFKRAQ